MDAPEYDFLRTNPNLQHIILLGLGGSHAYGTNIETSDIDLRGIALNSAQDIILGTDFQHVHDEHTDTMIYSLKKIIPMLANADPATIELLGLRPEDYFLLSPEGQMILDNASAFLSRKCINTFRGYVNQQAYLIKQRALCTITEEEFNTHIAQVLNRMIDSFQEKYHLQPGEIRPYVQDDILMIDLHINHLSADRLASILNELNQTVRTYRSNSKKLEKKAASRAKIAKTSMHLIRAYAMATDLLNKREVITYRANEHNLLMDIRNQKYMLDNGQPSDEFFQLVHEYDVKFEEAIARTTLPEKPDMRTINSLIFDINKAIVVNA